MVQKTPSRMGLLPDHIFVDRSVSEVVPRALSGWHPLIANRSFDREKALLIYCIHYARAEGGRKVKRVGGAPIGFFSSVKKARLLMSGKRRRMKQKGEGSSYFRRPERRGQQFVRWRDVIIWGDAADCVTVK